jgi:D-glycero-D-manno-heptose 1,7-bisphosphate phosphatase
MVRAASAPPRLRKGQVVILDRDGTVVVDRHYLADPDGLEFEPGAAEGLRKMTAMGCRLVIVTNQSGIARGFFSPAQLESMHDRLRSMVESAGSSLEAIYFCPHGPGEGCDCRKPNLGLMRQASAELGFEMPESIVIGDKLSDIEFGLRAGAVTMLVGGAETSGSSVKPDHVIGDLTEAADLIAGGAGSR